jgi:hypothetical protein
MLTSLTSANAITSIIGTANNDIDTFALT